MYRELRASKHGEELRWLVNCETILNKTTGQIVTRSHLRHPGICVIVPFTDDDRIVLMRQYRYAANEALWELPAGTLAGKEGSSEEIARMVALETPEECAARELLEETGYAAAQLEKVCECYAMPGSSDELMHVFFARKLQRQEQALDIGEVIYEIRGFSREELEAVISGGEIRDAKTLVGLFFALTRWAAPNQSGLDQKAKD
ncbi:MAG: NUDIX hydrolase [Acidobacteriota bacterium]|nr:NUDIX hydrolase [Acidobacteriota bacterium]